MIPIYASLHVTKISIKNVQAEIEAQRVGSAISFDMEKMAILKMTVLEQQNWIRKSIEILMQIDQDLIDNILNLIKLPDRHKFYIIVDDRKPRCYLCGSEAHLKNGCLKAKEEQQQQQEKTGNKEALLPMPPSTQKFNNKQKQGVKHINQIHWHHLQQ